MRNIRLVIAYDGADFHGWERQHEQRTVQQTLEEAIASLTGETVRLRASGRTDAGVHALGQVVNFHTSSRLDSTTIVRALNALLPSDLVVRAGDDVPLAFDANHDCVSKRYRYVIHDAFPPDPFLRRYVCSSRVRLDHEAMHRAGQCLVGTHDFHSFETQWPNRQTSVRTILHIEVGRAQTWTLWQEAPNQSINQSTNQLPVADAESVEDHPRALPAPFIYLDVEADGFLYNMVRAIAGTLINVGRGYWPESKVREILAAQDRRAAGPTAPPQGLFLVYVRYEQ